MRKLLLATAATMGALLATTGGAKAQPLPNKIPAAGTIAIHVNGYLQFEIADFGSSDNTVGLDKLSPITTNGDARLYAGIDALTLNGIQYGAQIELRTAKSDAAQGANQTTGSASGAASGLDGLYVKRAYGYIGTKDDGYVRLGQGDGAYTLLQTGVVEAFGDGAQFNTDGGVGALLPTDAAITGSNNFIYADTSNLYATDKVVYLSPAITEPFLGGAFSAGVSYEPNSNGLKEGYGNCAAASTASATPVLTCADVSASPDSGNIGKQRKNTVDAALQYALKLNGFATKASVGILHGSPISYDGAAALSAKYGYDDLNVYEIGAQTTYAGITVSGNIKAGQTLDGYSFKAKGTHDALAYIVGATYVIGPYVLGASFIHSTSAGAYVPGSADGKTLSEYGATIGANYVVGKDLSLFVQYMYDHRHQYKNAGLDVNNPTRGSAQAQVISTGATFKW